MSSLAVLTLLLLQTGAHGFGINFFPVSSWTHQRITESAILNVTVHVCHAVALANGKNFTFPPQLSAESVAGACGALDSSKRFSNNIFWIKRWNIETDIFHVFSSSHHFDNENFSGGRQLITEGLSVVSETKKQQNFEAARKNLGKVMHTLQDFYSHSNWVEMGNTVPNSNLIRSVSTDIGKIADKSRATCRSCDGGNCDNNILEDILQEKILTSGYFELNPFIFKPKGKCSHGGLFDFTSYKAPKGGINKDSLDSNHGKNHTKAANVAIAATSELLEDVRQTAGDTSFLLMMGIYKSLCFVVDTTGSMSDDIASVNDTAFSIIDSKQGREEMPWVYVLVPFNDPGLGPLYKTTDPNVFKRYINSLSAKGGGDAPEMSLSGLQLALIGAPPGSEIFVFTDAPAKDVYLKQTVIALIEQTKSVVNFMITNVPGLRRRRQSDDNQQQQQYRMLTSDFQLYKELAEVSGGQAIQVAKSELLRATSIVRESTSASQVTLLQAVRDTGNAENFTFTVDETVKNLTVYITGKSVTSGLISPSGVHQDSTNMTGSLITASQSVGNFQTLQLNTQVGLWEIKMVSPNPYTLKVVGDSPIDFLFNFLEVSKSPLGGFNIVDGRPRAGVNASMMVTISGSDSAIVREVTLVESLGSGMVNGTIETQSGRNILIRFDKIPSARFAVLVKGQISNTSTTASSVPFQRQSSTTIRSSNVTVTVTDTNSVLVPGTPRLLLFSVTTSGAGGNFIIQVTNDQGFSSSFPSSLSLEAGGSAYGIVTITAPPDTTSGTSVTLTIGAEAPGGADTNYAVLRLTVQTTVTVTQPVCLLLSLLSNCSNNCSLSMWELSVQVTDGFNGTGIDVVRVIQGSGILNTSLTSGNVSTTLVSYRASCCSPDVELLVVDQAGNVGICSYTIRNNLTTTTETSVTAATSNTKPVTSFSTKTVQFLFLCLSILIPGLTLP